MTVDRGRGVVIAAAAVVALEIGLGARAFAKQTRDVQVEIWPVGRYPRLAEWLNLEGRCDVRFAIDEAGYAFAVQPSCTRKIFCYDAKRAVSAAKFSPKLVDGFPAVRTNVVLPMEYSMKGSAYDPQTDSRPLMPCEELTVS